MLRFSLVFLATLVAVKSNEFNRIIYKTVETNSGLIRGRLNHTLLQQKDYFAFKGIPFAKPPIGELRFKAPEPIDPWSTTLEAFEYGPACPQFDDIKTFNETREDCLFLNIFVPVLNQTKKLPVLIFVHGGSFVKGAADDVLHGPDFLLEHEIVIVTLSYRLGVLGFMSLGTPEFSGNQGLKDQQVALKWIYENIEGFGGDKAQITLGGHSAGAMMVGHHLLNEESKQYFQQMLCMSGTAIIATTYVEGDHRCIIETFAKHFVPTIENDEEIIEFMQSAPLEHLVELTKATTKHITDLVWTPIIENENAVRPFILDDPTNELEDLSYINKTAYFTYANREMLSFFPENFPQKDALKAYLKNFYTFLPVHGLDTSIWKKPYLQDIRNEIRNFYFSNATSEFEQADQYLVMNNDILITFFVEKWLLKHINTSQKNTFYHRFSVDSMLNIAKRSKFPGAGHGDELCYVFNCRRLNGTYKQIETSKDVKSTVSARTINYMTKLVSNFVKYGDPAYGGDPIEGFKPLNANEINFLDVTNNGLTVGKSPNGNRINFLKKEVGEAKRLITEHGDLPKQTHIERICSVLSQMIIDHQKFDILSMKFVYSLAIFSILVAFLLLYSCKMYKTYRGPEIPLEKSEKGAQKF